MLDGPPTYAHNRFAYYLDPLQVTLSYNNSNSLFVATLGAPVSGLR